MNYSTKKKHLYFVLTILSALLTLAGMVILLVIPTGQFQLFYMIIELLIGLLLMSIFRYNLDREIYMHQYYLLLKNKSEPYLIKTPILTQSWINQLKNEGYQQYKHYKHVSYYYRIDQIATKTKHGKTLVLLILIHDDSLNFDSELIIEHINALEVILRKKEKYRQRIFIHAKSFKNKTETSLDLTEHIFWIRKGTTYLVSLNLSYFEDEQSIYYIHNTSYYPNKYYQHAIQTIQGLLP